jgi:putative membrane protein insertion efficiency factor
MLARAASAVAVSLIRLYQRVISAALPRRCKYEPTCSAYAISAVRTLGVLRGTVLAAWRLLRCNPFSRGGYDPVEAQTLFRSPGSPSSSRPKGSEAGDARSGLPAAGPRS